MKIKAFTLTPREIELLSNLLEMKLIWDDGKDVDTELWEFCEILGLCRCSPYQSFRKIGFKLMCENSSDKIFKTFSKN